MPVNACCEDPGNLSAPECPNPAQPDATVQTCRVCGRRHFRLKVDPIPVGVEGAPVGE